MGQFCLALPVTLIEIARIKGFQVEERLVLVEELFEADEVFSTGNAVLLPVRSITYICERSTFFSWSDLASSTFQTFLSYMVCPSSNLLNSTVILTLSIESLLPSPVRRPLPFTTPTARRPRRPPSSRFVTSFSSSRFDIPETQTYKTSHPTTIFSICHLSFSILSASSIPLIEEDGIQILQVYSKEINKRMLDTVSPGTSSLPLLKTAPRSPRL
ncbi:WPP domain-containing protein 2-like [Pyrus ussuriensis x Pyrus communis]|uniref:WPP domain-containing protein 2-like n=1 Tax=Pyrus ussuriensis x Pyrus communis TaxID=2448454 RepID=A0A5N5HIA5_9ROSA|nr:WPP domain-containing protein 2-like [Pyrus ussuriensis x Pyrus communis]